MVVALSDPFLVFPKEPGHHFFYASQLDHARAQDTLFFLSIENKKSVLRDASSEQPRGVCVNKRPSC
jgi:hypothetical protein